MKILLVEDDFALRSALLVKLEKSGFEVLVAKDGEEALEKFSQKPDLVLLDLMLPKKTGFEFLEIAKNMPEFKNTKVWILSVLTSETDIKRGLELGAVEYLVKADLNIDDLVSKIKVSELGN